MNGLTDQWNSWVRRSKKKNGKKTRRKKIEIEVEERRSPFHFTWLYPVNLPNTENVTCSIKLKKSVPSPKS